MATDGCLVLANTDVNVLLKTVEPKTTPVLIAQSIDWVQPETIQASHHSFEHTFLAWRNARNRGEMGRTLSFYAQDFNSFGKDLQQYKAALKRDMKAKRQRVDNLSLLRWADHEEVMMVTFDEIGADKSGAQKNRTTRRQYWIRSGNHWKIFFEGIIG